MAVYRKAALVTAAALGLGGVAATGVALTGAGAAVPATVTPATIDPTVTPAVTTRSGASHPARSGGIFTERCGYADTASIDPILMPGMTGMSMSHDFFGNRSVTASSTPGSLAGGTTTCDTSADSSAYWAPTLYQDGHALTSRHTIIYWRTSAANASTVQTMPAGLTMIAGNEHATSPQGLDRVRWTCAGRGSKPDRFTTTPHDCVNGGDIRVAVIFPSCWDGTTLNGATQTNVVYPTRGSACPADHPHVIPQLIVHFEYPTSSAAGLTLSTGPGTSNSTDSEHVDFMNAFSATPLASDVTRCLTGDTRCGRVTGPDAVPGPPPAR